MISKTTLKTRLFILNNILENTIKYYPNTVNLKGDYHSKEGHNILGLIQVYALNKPYCNLVPSTICNPTTLRTEYIYKEEYLEELFVGDAFQEVSVWLGIDQAEKLLGVFNLQDYTSFIKHSLLALESVPTKIEPLDYFGVDEGFKEAYRYGLIQAMELDLPILFDKVIIVLEALRRIAIDYELEWTIPTSWTQSYFNRLVKLSDSNLVYLQNCYSYLEDFLYPDKNNDLYFNFEF